MKATELSITYRSRELRFPVPSAGTILDLAHSVMLITGARSTLRIKAGDHLFQSLVMEQDVGILLAGLPLNRLVALGENMDDIPSFALHPRRAQIYTIENNHLPPGAPSSDQAWSLCKELVSERNVDVLVHTSRKNLAINVIAEARPEEQPQCYLTKPSFRVIKMPFRDASYSFLPRLTFMEQYIRHLAHLSVVEHGPELDEEVECLLDDVYRIQRWFDAYHRAIFSLEEIIEKALGASQFRPPPVDVFFMMLSGAYYRWETVALERDGDVDTMLAKARRLVPKLAQWVRKLEEEVSVPEDFQRALEILYTICTSAYRHGTGCSEYVRLMSTRAYARLAGNFKSVKKMEGLLGFDENGIASSKKWACWVASTVFATQLSRMLLHVN